MIVCIIKRFFLYVYQQIPVQSFVFNTVRSQTSEMVKYKIKNT